MATEKQEGREENMETDIKKPKKVDPKKRLAFGMMKAGGAHLPAKDSLQGV